MLCQPQQIPDMIDTGLRAFIGLLFVLSLEGRQFELLQMVLQKKLRFVINSALALLTAIRVMSVPALGR
jgi:hypothetical protein